MIRSHSLHSGLDYVELIWILPEHLPEKYILHVHVQHGCTLKPRSVYEQDKNKYVMTNAQYLTPDRTSVRLPNLGPKSVCTLFLLAVYNPASIDSGIATTGTTLDEGTSKRKTCSSLRDQFNIPPSL